MSDNNDVIVALGQVNAAFRLLPAGEDVLAARLDAFNDLAAAKRIEHRGNGDVPALIELAEMLRRTA